MKNLLFTKTCNLFFVYILIVVQKETKADCDSVQYAELGSRWIAKCSFPSEFIIVYWYESVTSATDTDVIEYEVLGVGDARYSGVGYKSDLYDIHQNGALVIRHVAIENERTYKVVLIDNQLALHEYEFELKALVLTDLETRIQCEPLQYTDLGNRWTAECSFPFQFTSVDWYEPVTSESNTGHILRYEKVKGDTSVVSGEGYETGQYSILPNGSLVIPNVTIENEGAYRVVVTDNQFIESQKFELKTRDLKIRAHCEPMQYIDLGSKWTAECSFPTEFISVDWYEMVKKFNADLLLRYEILDNGDAVVSGEGYESGQYSILPNGSLVIPNVTIENEGAYRVILINTRRILHTYELTLKKRDLNTPVNCEPLQYAAIGSRWIAKCSFPIGFTSVYWYDSVTSESNTDPILRYENLEGGDAIASGEGYKNGQYGILPNGSLMIPYVTIKNVGTYRVLVIDTAFSLHESKIELQTTDYTDLETSTVCEPLQYAELWSKWIAECSFPIEFISIYWYDSITSESNTDPVLRYERGVDGFVVSGIGYTRGIYDIQPNGSLVIPNVTIENERTYKAIVLDNSFTLFEYEILLKTKVSPRQKFPRVNGCEESTCLITYQPGLVLGCSIYQVRPPASLSWYLKKGDGEKRIDTPQTTYSDGHLTYTSSISINITQLDILPLIELFCRVSGIHSTSSLLATYILTDNSVNLWDEHHPSTTIEQYVSLNNPTSLSCTDKAKPLTFIWKRFQHYQSTVLAFSGRNDDRLYATANLKIDVSQLGQLSIDQCDFTCMGRFMCIYTDGEIVDTTVYRIVVLTGPSPPFLIVDGCPQGLQTCNLHFTSSDDPQHLTCSIQNVCPEPYLYFRSDPSLETTIVNYQRKIAANHTFNVSLHGKLRLLEPSGCNSVLTVSCIASGPALSSFTLYKTIEVTYDTCQSLQLPTSTEQESRSSAVVVLLARVIVALALIATTFNLPIT